MATTLEVRPEEDLHHLLGNPKANGPRSHAEHIGVVVEARHLGGEAIVAESRPHPVVAVGDTRP